MNYKNVIRKSLGKCKLMLFALLFTFSSFSLFAQKALGTIKESPGKILSFEIPDEINQIEATESSFKQTNVISLLGKNSLQWDWKAGASIKLPLYNFYSEVVKLSPYNKDQCLVMWLYSDEPSDDFLTLTLTGEELDTITGKFYLNYTGWRTAHIPLSQMEGNTPQKGDFNPYQWLEIDVPEDHSVKKGRYFLDDVYTTMIDDRHPSADYQAPYVKAIYNGGPHVTQWMDQKELPLKEDLEIKQIPVSKSDIKSFDQLYDSEMKQMTDSIKNSGLSYKKFHEVQSIFEQLNIKQIKREDKIYLQGPYIALAGEGLPRNIINENIESGHLVYLEDFQEVLYRLAKSYHMSTDQKQKETLKDYFILATKAYLQSGWAEGSNMGAIHHLGYSSRRISPSFFMMKKELFDGGLLDEVSRSLNWYNVAHVVNNDTHTKPDLDLFNTILYPHYLSSMMHPNKEDATRHAKLLSQWVSRTYADDTKHGGFKHDGTGWHHWGHYPAYTNHAIDNAVIVANKLSLAGFPLTKDGHKALQKAVKTVMLFSQGNCIPRSLSGRHPFRGSHKDFINSEYVNTFVNIEPIDSELKELHSYHNSENEFSGHWTLPYSAMNLHRRKDYLVGVRGFGIYSWGAEIYNLNRFGRYQSYGTVDILYKNDKQLSYEGYDWNLHPGTTITYLPLEELESPIPVFMVKSLSRFANGVHDKEGLNGAHGFILDESVLINIDPEYKEIPTKEKLKARKSTFFMDDIVLCIGTGISGQNKEHPVYTVIAQEGVKENERDASIGGKTIDIFPFEDKLNGKQMLYDGKRNGYLNLDKNSTLSVSMKQQISRGDECTFDELRKPPRETKNGKVNLRREPETKGDFFTVTIEHGIQPTNASYIYAILPGVNETEFTLKATQILEHPELYYHVISSKNNLHAVRDIRNNSETYICYEPQKMIPHYNLHEVSDPCLIIFKYNETGNQAVSVSLPDLHQTAYSREQKDKQWTSREHDLKLIFDGIWNIDSDTNSIFNTEHVGGKTIITVKAQHGESNHFDMTKS